MRTREPILTRGRDHWDRVNLPESEFRERIERVRQAMAAEGLDALLLYGTGDRDGDIAYVSNLVHKVPGFPLALVVTQETAVVLNQRSSRTRPIVKRSTWIDDVRFTRNLWEAFDDVLEEVTDPGADVGFAGETALTHPDRAALKDLQSTWSIVIRDGLLDDLRQNKSDRELDQLRRAGRVVREVADDLPKVVTSSVRERQFEAELDRLARLKGAQDVRILLSNPGRTEDNLRPAETRLTLGDGPISVYIAVRFEGYWAALARTPAWGDTENQKEQVVTYEGLLDAIGSGRDARSVLKAVEDRESQLAREYPFVSGIGLELDEPPAFGPATPEESFEFQPGMAIEVTLAVRPSGNLLSVQGDTVIVTDEGAEVVTQ